MRQFLGTTLGPAELELSMPCSRNGPTDAGCSFRRPWAIETGLRLFGPRIPASLSLRVEELLGQVRDMPEGGVGGRAARSGRSAQARG
jgi:hypothetical protein